MKSGTRYTITRNLKGDIVVYSNRNGWKQPIKTPFFITTSDAYTWLAISKFNSNYALASQQINY